MAKIITRNKINKGEVHQKHSLFNYSYMLNLIIPEEFKKL